MLKLILLNILMLWGLSIFCFESYRLIRQRRKENSLLHLFAGLITFIGTLIDGTVLVYFARAGYQQSMFILHNITFATIIAMWVYVTYKDRVFDYWK